MYERLSKRVQGRRDEGFTLIELLIVIVILGILAAIVVFAIGSTRGDSVASSCKTNFKSVELSAEAVRTKTGKYPVGTIIKTTANNPLVSDSSNGAATPAPIANGALLREFPSSGDYNLEYVGAADGKSFKITVKNGAATPAAVGGGAATPANPTVSDCESL